MAWYYVFSAIPFLIVLLVTLGAICWMGVTIARPAFSVFVLLAILIAFSGSTWGQLEVERTIYSRGTGVLYFSFVNYYLWGLGLVVALRNAFGRTQGEATPLAKYFAAFAFLIVANALWAGASDDSRLNFMDAFAYNGLLNIINMAVFFYVVVNVFGFPAEMRKLLAFLLVAVGLRGVFGMVRWGAFGGDSANVYANIENAAVRLTFFDISDGFLATVAAFCAAWLLFQSKQLLTNWERRGLWCLLILELVVIALSFRRSSLVGMGLVCILFVALLPSRKRLWAALISGTLLGGAGVMLMALRLSKTGAAARDGGFLYDLFAGGGAQGSSRLLEYTETWRSLGDYWLFGRGMWGAMQSNLAELSYHFGNFGFVHSGFGHVLLKAGVFGLVLFVGLFVSFALYYIRNRENLSGYQLLTADAGAAGVLFWIPTLFIGTPIIEFRSMLLLGLALALPFLAVRAATMENFHATA